MESSDWRRNPWVWLLIAIPAATVIGCMFTIYLAITNPDVLVSDDIQPAAPTQGTSDLGQR